MRLVSVDKVDPPLKASGSGCLASSPLPFLSSLSTHYLAPAAKWSHLFIEVSFCQKSWKLAITCISCRACEVVTWVFLTFLLITCQCYLLNIHLHILARHAPPCNTMPSYTYSPRTVLAAEYYSLAGGKQTEPASLEPCFLSPIVKQLVSLQQESRLTFLPNLNRFTLELKKSLFLGNYHTVLKAMYAVWKRQTCRHRGRKDVTFPESGACHFYLKIWKRVSNSIQTFCLTELVLEKHVVGERPTLHSRRPQQSEVNSRRSKE